MKKVLIIDGDLDCMTLVKKCLEKKGHEVEYAFDKKELPKIVEKFNPDVLIIDIVHSHLLNSGYIASVFKAKPVILLSSKIFTHIASRLPVHGIIEKPFELLTWKIKLGN